MPVVRSINAAVYNSPPRHYEIDVMAPGIFCSLIHCEEVVILPPKRIHITQASREVSNWLSGWACWRRRRKRWRAKWLDYYAVQRINQAAVAVA